MKRSEYRKLQFIGGSSFMVSLPKDWVEKFNLKQGDTLLVSVEEEGSIRIIPSSLIGRAEPPERAVIELPKLKDPERFKREIFAYYILGIDQIEINLKERIAPDFMSVLNEVTRSLIGIEITSMEDKKITLSCLTSKDLSIDSVLIRMKQLVNTIIDGMMSYLENRDERVLQSIFDMEEDVDRFYMLSVRLENIGMRRMHDSGLSSWDFLRMLLGHRLITKCIEEISDELMKIFEHLKELEDSPGFRTVLSGELESIKSCFDVAMSAFLEEDLERAHESYELGKMIEERLRKESENSNSQRDVRMKLILMSMIELCRILRTISEISINRSVRATLRKL
ncbi:MAG: phosphate uptake regulator PhoU [Archaeoglobi archaeon]|nr:phosphate uptake regulator PhoU [Candidatus Mnemosynella bozhongmuii]